MFADRRKEIGGILLILLSVMLFLSLMSFNIRDFEFLAINKPVLNIIGPIGAYFSDFLRAAFGYSSYFLVFIFAVSGWNLLKKGAITDVIERIFSLFYLMITLSIFISLGFDSAVPHFSGGYTGLYISKLFTGLFGRFGAYLVVIMLNLVGLVLIGILSFSSLINRLGEKGNFKDLLKSSVKRLFNYNAQEDLPYNRLDEAIAGRGKKMPWIIKRKIIVGGFNHEKMEMNIREPQKMIEMKEPFIPDEDSLFPGNTVNEPSAGTEIFDGSLEAGAFSADSDNDLTGSKSNNHLLIEMKDGINFNYGYSGLSGESTEVIPGEASDYDISYNDSESALESIEKNRIKSVVLEHEIHAVEIIESIEEEDDIDEIEEYAPSEETGREPGDNEKPVSYTPRVFFDIPINKEYIIPYGFLELSSPIDAESWESEARRNSELLVKTLRDFGVESRVTNVNRGPVITLYEIQIAPGIKVNRIVGLSDDIALALAAARVRIVAPIPGKSAIGVEIPNRDRENVTFGDIIMSPEYGSYTGRLKAGLGKDILGKPVMIDLKRMPHLLIAGATGSGKSVCVNSIISSLIYNYNPNYVRFILVDPKMVELQLYNGMPHLLTPVITESHEAPRALKWAMYEMERRYRLLSELNTRDIEKYNQKIAGYKGKYERLPYIVIIIDELADLMMIAAKEIEGFITRIAQKARAIGIHLVLATQRPSVDIITGIIKANFPARMAFQVAQKTDSRTILDQNGAETLLGRGDLLYQSPMSSFPVRIQGAYISEEEIMKIVRHLRGMGKPSYIDIDDEIFEDDDAEIINGDEDGLFAEALKIVEETKKASASYIQRRLSIGYNRAARIIEMMEERGYVGPQQGSKPREVYI